MGADRIITIDLHSSTVQGAVSPKTTFDDFPAGEAGIDFFVNEIQNKQDICIVAPDAGAIKRTKVFHKNFESRGYEGQIGVALMHKERKAANEVESIIIIGNVVGKTCILIDDMVDTAGTLCMAAKELKDQGAEKVYAFITHGIFSFPAANRITESHIEKIVVTDSMEIDQET
jgi:ribose-phosphate pyrophosphokinase